jgi:hypothetical protein
MRPFVRAAIGSGALLLVAMVGAAHAVPIGSLHANNAGISVFGFTFDGATNTITLRETWGNTGPGIVQLSGLDDAANYTVIKIITNATGVPWSSFAQELLDPVGFADEEDAPPPPFAPAGFTPSNEQDGLSFAQGSLIPRTSTVFGSVAADELAGRDFLDFFEGSLLDGNVDTMTFGLRDNAGIGDANCDGTSCPNQPFLLVQRPNARSDGTSVAAPTPLLLVGAGLAVLALVYRRRLVAL